MDEQLKRRLVGAAIVIMMAIVVVPLFFEDKTPSDPGSLPETMDEKTLVLPKTAEVSESPSGELPAALEPPHATTAKKRKYEVVPLDDGAPKPAKSETESAPASSGQQESPLEQPPESESEGFADEEGGAHAPSHGSGSAAASGSRKSHDGNVTHSVKSDSVRHSSVEQKHTDKSKQAGSSPHEAAASVPRASKKTGSTSAKTAITEPRSGAPAVKKVPVSPTVSKDPKLVHKPSPTAASGSKQTATGAASWTVQAGTFVDETNARSLVEKLKKRNLPARVHVTEGSSGKVYRVTVGPNLDRSRAEQIQQQLSAQDGVKGVMLPNH